MIKLFNQTSYKSLILILIIAPKERQNDTFG